MFVCLWYEGCIGEWLCNWIVVDLDYFVDLFVGFGG